MKIATYNINNINKRLDNLLSWISRAEPDVVCLQELKAETRNFPRAGIEAIGLPCRLAGRALLERSRHPIEEGTGDHRATSSGGR